jgi:hypothetical protein
MGAVVLGLLVMVIVIAIIKGSNRGYVCAELQRAIAKNDVGKVEAILVARRRFLTDQQIGDAIAWLGSKPL